MTLDKYIKTTFILATGGVLFSGYLGGIKLFSSTCAFNEPCPYFLGYPACYFGFAMFFIMFTASGLAFFKKMKSGEALKVLKVFSFLGMLFAGYYTLMEIIAWVSGSGGDYALILPTCAYGLIFYISIFVLSLKAKKN